MVMFFSKEDLSAGDFFWRRVIVFMVLVARDFLSLIFSSRAAAVGVLMLTALVLVSLSKER